MNTMCSYDFYKTSKNILGLYKWFLHDPLRGTLYLQVNANPGVSTSLPMLLPSLISVKVTVKKTHKSTFHILDTRQ